MKSFGLLRTNVGLTTNIKVTIDTNYKFSLDSIESDPNLSFDKFKKVAEEETEPLVLTDPVEVEKEAEPWEVDLDDVEHAVEAVIEDEATHKDVAPSETEVAKMADRDNLRAKRK